MASNGFLERTGLAAQVALAGVAHRIRPSVQQLILHVTKKCNFRCKHCFVDFSEIPVDLTLEQIKRISDTVGRLIWLDIGGGEPFLRKDLFEVISLFRFQEVSIPTNGWFKDRIVDSAERIGARFGNKVTIVLSVDGLRDTHDEIRGQPGSFDRLLETFVELRNIPDIRVGFLSTLCERNADELLKLIKSLEAQGPDYHAVNILRGEPIDPTYKLELDDARRFWVELERHYAGLGYSHRRGISSVPLNYIRLRWEKSLKTLEEQRQVIPCLGGTATVVVEPDGGVSSCETLPPVAYIKDQPLDKILRSPEWKARVQSIQAKECQCTHECNLKSSIFLNPTLYPSLLFHK